MRLADLIHGAVHAQVVLLDPHRALADALDLLHGVAHEQHRDVSVLDEVLDAAYQSADFRGLYDCCSVAGEVGDGSAGHIAHDADFVRVFISENCSAPFRYPPRRCAWIAPG